MKVKVKQVFRDKFNTSHLFKVGDVLDFDRERAENIVRLGLGELVKDEPATANEEKAPVVEEVPEAPKPKKPRKKKAE